MGTSFRYSRSKSNSLTNKTSTHTPLQVTLKRPISCRGIGLHTGKEVFLKLSPLPPDSGIQFRRTDLYESASFRLTPNSIIGTKLSTTIAPPHNQHASIATIEHLVSALHALAIDNILIELNGPEIPIFDGSAQDFVFLLHCAGRQDQDVSRRFIKILHPVIVQDDYGAYASFKPGPNHEFRLNLEIDFPASIIGKQHINYILNQDSFSKEIAYSRTFVDYDTIVTLQEKGMALGGSLKNALVVQNNKVLNATGLKCPDEFVRHKLLDAIGDFYCAGYQIIGIFEGSKSGHHLNNQLLKTLWTHKKNWKLV